MPPAIDGRVFKGLLLALYVVLFCLRSLETLQEIRPPQYDAQEYVTVAWNLAHHGAVSVSPERPDKPPWPTMHRTPGYPLLLALGILASPGLRGLGLSSFFEDASQPLLRPLRAMQLLLVPLVALIAMRLAWEITRSRALAFLTLGLVGLDNELISLSGRFLSENLAVVLLTALSLCLAVTVGRLDRRLFGLSGGLLAALALTRPAYAQLCLPLLAFFGVLWLRRPAQRRAVRAGVVLFLICFAAPVTAWMARNALRLGRAVLADGGGVALEVRARLDLMTPEQYAAAFLYWSRSWYLQEILPRHFDDRTVDYLGGSSPDGAYKQAFARLAALTMEHGSVTADSLLLSEARSGILGHPWRHLAVTLPVALRGIYVHGIVLSTLLFSCLLGGFAMACVRRDAVTIAALLPPVYMFAFHSFLTENLPRFNQPCLALLWVSLALTLSRLDRRGGGPATGVDPAGPAA